jgi:integrase
MVSGRTQTVAFIEMIMVSSAAASREGGSRLAVVVTVAKGYDLGYIWKTQSQASAGHITGGYYINAAQAGEPSGRWWGPGAQALGLTSGQVVERRPYDAVCQQRDPWSGDKLGRARGRYATFADHLAQLKAAEPHATAERLIELEREAAQATRQPAAYTDVTVSFSKSISVLHASIRENRPRTDAPVTEIDAELKEVTCRACRAQLGIDDNADAAVRLEALFVLSITVGLRPGELRKLTWDLVDLDAGVIHVWRSASRSGDVKTPKSKRSLTLPKRALVVLKAHKRRQAAEREAAREAWHDSNLVFCHEDGTMYTRDALNWRFSKMTRRAGIGHWHAHEARYTAVSIMSNNGVPIQDIADTVGHKSTHVTETVYRHVIAPAIRGGASVMDDVFGDDDTAADQA